jgi:hypothetical protein
VFLALLVQAIARRDVLDLGDMGDPPDAIADALLDAESGWTADQTCAYVEDRSVHIALARAPWRLGTALPSATDALASYDSVTGTWAWAEFPER